MGGPRPRPGMNAPVIIFIYSKLLQVMRPPVMIGAGPAAH